MFDEEDDDRQQNGGTFKINKKFERTFNERKAREDLERAKAKYGKEIDNLGDDSDSSLPEDEDAVLDDEEVTLKVLSTLSKIKNKNPEIYDPKARFFDDVDLDKRLSRLESGKMLGKRQPAMTYKRQVQEMAAAVEAGQDVEGMSDELNEEDETPFEQQQRLKREFQSAAMDEEEEEEGDLFTVKPKTKKQIADEEEEFRRYVELQKKRNITEAKELKKAFGDKQQLDEGEQFLRNFILTKGWIDQEAEDSDQGDFTHMTELGETIGNNKKLKQKMLEADAEDEARDQEMEAFEERINFRFERPGGTKITTYERDIDDTMRRKDEGRADKRKERDLRKKEEKEAFKNEIEHIKELKRDEINSKIRKLLQAGGLSNQSKAKQLQDLVGQDFNEDDYDKKMQAIFDDEYYEDEDEAEEDLEKYVEEIEAKVDATITGEPVAPKEDAPKKVADEEEDVTLNATATVPILMRKKLNKEEATVLQTSMNDNLWWYCDSCGRGILPLESRFDCMECDDYTECKQCADLKGHDHQMKKFIVPEGCMPPAKDEIEGYLQNVCYCTKCSVKLDGSQLYYKSKEIEDYYLCETCMHFSKKKKNKKAFDKVMPTKLSVSTILEKGDYHKLQAAGVDSELSKLVDEYYNIDFEDVIAGGLKTRFKYTKVEQDDFNLDDDDILFADERILNKYLSIKKLAPYKEDAIQDKHRKRMKKMIGLVKNSAEKNKQEVVRMIELEKEEEYLKMMSKKNQKYKKKLERFYEKKERIMKNQDARAKEQEDKDNFRLTNMTNVEEPMTLEDAGVSSQRLKSYNL